MLKSVGVFAFPVCLSLRTFKLHANLQPRRWSFVWKMKSMPLLCLFTHLYFCCFVRCKHAAPNFAEIWVWNCAVTVFGCCEVLQITECKWMVLVVLVGSCVAHAGFNHSFSALIKLTSWYFPIIRKRVFSSRLRLDFISCFVSVINTWTWKGVAVYHQLCSPITPPAAGPAPTRFLSVSSPAELPVAFFPDT